MGLLKALSAVVAESLLAPVRSYHTFWICMITDATIIARLARKESFCWVLRYFCARDGYLADVGNVLWFTRGMMITPIPPRVARLSGRASDGGSRGMMWVDDVYAALRGCG